MNCESIQTLLDHTELNAISDSERRAAQSHIASCTDCAAVVGVHDEFLAMRIPSVPADLEKRCFERIASAPDVRVRRRRAGLFVLGSFVIAAAAAIVGPTWFAADDEASVAEDASQSDSTSVQSTSDSGTDLGGPDPGLFTAEEGDVGATSAIAAPTSPDMFTVELTRLVPVNETPQGSQFGGWFYAALVEELVRVPNLVLIEAAGPIEVPSIPWVDSSEREFSFDRDTTTWPDDYDIRLAAGASVGDDWVGKRWTAVSAEGRAFGGTSESDAMRRSVEANPAYAVSLAAEVVENLHVHLFPADASSLSSQIARYESILADTAADVWERHAALDAAWTLARRANDAKITARLVDDTLRYAEQVANAVLSWSMFAGTAAGMSASEMAAWRAQFAADAPADVLEYLRGTDDDRVIQPVSEALLYDQSEAVRRVAASILGEFVDDPFARAALESAAEFDASSEVRETATNYLLDDAVLMERIFAVVRDSSLSDEERLRPIFRSNLSQFVEPGFRLDAATVDAVSDLIKRSDEGTRGNVLFYLDMYRSPSFVPVYLERLRNDPSPEVRVELLYILSEYRSLPDVDIALEEAAADDPTDDVRAAAARILNDADP